MDNYFVMEIVEKLSSAHFHVIALLILLSQMSCSSRVSGVWKNDKIDIETREKVKSLNDQLINGIASTNYNEVKSLMSEELLASIGTKLESVILQTKDYLKSSEYSVLDEYHILNGGSGVVKIQSGINQENDYKINGIVANNETYISLLLVKTNNQQKLIVAIYVKSNNDWELNVLQYGLFSLFNKTAITFYKQAQVYEKNDNLIDAINNMTLSLECLRPANDYFTYQKDDEIKKYSVELVDEFKKKYGLPFPLNNISTHPKIFSIYPKIIDEGIFPMVDYQTTINLKDTQALSRENKETITEVDRTFKGINEGKKYVFFRAYNELPDGKKLANYYGFVETTKYPESGGY